MPGFPTRGPSEFANSRKDARLAAYMQAGMKAEWAAITAGAAGAAAADKRKQVRIPVFRAGVPHARCAGAAFSGGLIYGLIHGWPMQDCLDLASASGALRCEHRQTDRTDAASSGVLLRPSRVIVNGLTCRQLPFLATILSGRGLMMSGSRWRLPAAGATVIVSAATGVLINFITSRWSLALGVGLAVLLVIGVMLQVMLTAGDDRAGPADGESARSQPGSPGIRQTARARGTAAIIQAGGDVIVPPASGRTSPGDGQDPGR